jgi:phage/plasmid primase-like uncharacterized protein
MSDFRAHILAYLGHAPENIYPGRLIRFPTSDRMSDRAGWCKLFADGRAGVFGDWRTNVTGTWYAVDRQRGARERQRMCEALGRAQREEADARKQGEHAARRKNAALWAQCTPISPRDAADLYLMNRGLGLEVQSPDALRFHPALDYWEMGGRKLGTFPAMVAMVKNAAGEPVALHRTYLTPDGMKAPVPAPKKLTGTSGTLAGSSIHLWPPRLIDGEFWLGVAEGIETAIAADLMFRVPTVAALSAHGLETFQWPAEVTHLVVFADNDRNGVGENAARALAARAAASGVETRIMLPRQVGDDWANVFEDGGDVDGLE